MSNLVIVAIPDENDRVWKVSSEKVPHLTLLFLGEQGEVANLEQILGFVEHAATTTLNRFFLTVDRRGELGDDPDLGPADVLFFKKGRYDYQAIRNFRAALLQDNNIKTAYDSASQFDGPWQPHLTLGYQGTPAKPDPDDYPFYEVSFNKIAVWTGDYDGPEFLLKDYFDEYDALETVPMDVAMSDLQHHGVKGMQWGVRKAEPTSARAARREAGNNPQALKVALFGSSAVLSPTLRKNVSTSTALKVAAFGPFSLLDRQAHTELIAASKKVKLDKADKSWDRQLANGQAYVAVHNKIGEHFNKGIDAVNNKYPEDRDWSKEDYSNPKDPTFKKYVADVHKLTKDSIEKAMNDLNLQNPSGTKEVKVQQDPQEPLTFKMTVHDKAAAKHAAVGDPEINFKVKYNTDAKGRITGFEIDDPASAAHSVDLGATLVAEILSGEQLEHYGVKGMHWGVRQAQAVTTRTHLDSGLRRRQTKVRAEGGHSQDAHPDAIKAAVAKQMIKKSGHAALSTQELRDLANRLQVENQVSILMSSKGKQFVNQQLENEGKQALKTGAKAGIAKAAPHVFKKVRRTAATGAAAAALAL